MTTGTYPCSRARKIPEVARLNQLVFERDYPGGYDHCGAAAADNPDAALRFGEATLRRRGPFLLGDPLLLALDALGLISRTSASTRFTRR